MGLLVLEKIFLKAYMGMVGDGCTDDAQTPRDPYTLSSPCEPDSPSNRQQDAN